MLHRRRTAVWKGNPEFPREIPRIIPPGWGVSQNVAPAALMKDENEGEYVHIRREGRSFVQKSRSTVFKPARGV
jgi:hypothetical protein